MINKRIFAKAVGGFVPKITQKAFEKYGFSTATLLTDWAAIVGADLAQYTQPDKLKWPRNVNAYGDVEDGDKGRPGATLILRVDNARAIEVQYKGAQIIDRINAYFGYRAVDEMRILQAPVTDHSVPKPPAYEKLEPLADPPEEIAAIEDEPLRNALALMAAGIERKRARGK